MLRSVVARAVAVSAVVKVVRDGLEGGRGTWGLFTYGFVVGAVLVAEEEEEEDRAEGENMVAMELDM